MTDLREGCEHLRSLPNPLNCLSRGPRVICGDVLEDVPEPALSFLSPRYLCHERMRRPISSFETLRFAFESASPRSIIR